MPWMVWALSTQTASVTAGPALGPVAPACCRESLRCDSIAWLLLELLLGFRLGEETVMFTALDFLPSLCAWRPLEAGELY